MGVSGAGSLLRSSAVPTQGDEESTPGCGPFSFSLLPAPGRGARWQRTSIVRPSRAGTTFSGSSPALAPRRLKGGAALGHGGGGPGIDSAAARRCRLQPQRLGEPVPGEPGQHRRQVVPVVSSCSAMWAFTRRSPTMT
jgi:hypothetical protein